MPAEWEAQERIWLSWPVHPDSWPGETESIERQFAALVELIGRHAKVGINAPQARHEHIWQRLGEAGVSAERVDLYPHPNNDVWCRDHGPIFLQHPETGAQMVVNWEFNGWGDQFGPYDLDNTIPRRVGETLGLPCVDGGMVLEGGAIEVNGQGQLLTTEAVLLNANRNPEWGREEIESRLRGYLGVNEVFWLGEGIEGDDTGGHIDDVARFVSDETLVLSWEPKSGNANSRILHENRERLEDFRTFAGSRPEVIEIPMPRLSEVPDWRLPVLPATYVNFLIVNDAVIVPVFGDRERDRQACGMLGELFPGRRVHPFSCLDFVHEGGAIHCLTQQQPAVVSQG